MIFCTNCGRQLPDNAKFCDSCGAVVPRNQPGAPEQKAQQPSQPTPFSGQAQQQPSQPTPAPKAPCAPQQVSPAFVPKQKRPVWLIPVIVGAVAVVCVALAALLLSGKGQRGSLSPVSSVGSAADPEGEDTQYAEHNNEEACFALEYPEGYELTEPNANNVMIVGDNGDFQIMAEYAFATPNDTFIYNAEDFANLLTSDSAMLTNWLGIEAEGISDVSKEKGGCKIEFDVTINALPYRGTSYIFDTEGNYGCYVLQFLILDTSSLKQTYQKQMNHVADSFRVTGTPEETYEIHYVEEFDCTFAAKPEAIALQNMSKWEEFSLYPISGAFSNAFIAIADLGIDSNFGAAISAVTDYTLHSSKVLSTTETAHLPLGRYDYLEQDLVYQLAAEEYTEHDIVFPRGDTYWKIQMICTEETSDVCWDLLADLLVSLRFEDDAYLKAYSLSGTGGGTDEPASAGGAMGVNEVLDQIESRTGFRTSSDYEPLACYVDLDNDGTHEFIAAYQSKDGNDYTVQYEAWSFPENGSPVQVSAGELYTEAGSMRGSVSLVLNKKGKLHLAMETSHFEGDRKIEIRAYIPWENGALNWEDGTQMRCSLPMDGGKAEYYINERLAPAEDYEDFTENFPNPQTIDLQAGHGNGGEVAEFDMIRQWYGK